MTSFDLPPPPSDWPGNILIILVCVLGGGVLAVANMAVC